MWNSTIDSNGKHIAYDSERLTFATKKRIGKVFRNTFSKQPETLASIFEPDSIPSDILNKKNFIDVTDEYTQVGSLNYNFKNLKKGFAYLSVYNSGNWELTDWAKVNNYKATFTNLGKDVVYLPAIGTSKNIFLEAYPIILKKNGESHLLKPDFNNPFSCKLTRENETLTEYEEENSTKIIDEEKYNLFYWNKKWIHHESATVVDRTLNFNNVPSNALFILLKDKPDSYERIFTINPNNEKITWY